MNIGYDFKDKSLLRLAMMHVSYAKDKGLESNQRLEFLGDSVLSLLTASYIYKHYPHLPEGKLTEFRANIVCEESLAQLAEKLNLGAGLKFSNSERLTNGCAKPSILADTFEAVLGAIYLDGGLECASRWYLSLIVDVIEDYRDAVHLNAKTVLQEYFQKNNKNYQPLRYLLKNKTGFEHAPLFSVDVLYHDKVVGSGDGNSKKLAERNAAKDAIKKLNLSLNEHFVDGRGG